MVESHFPPKEQEEDKIRVLVVDDIPETRENLRKLLFFESDIEIVGAATDGQSGIDMAVELQPDIVLMDINMPGVDGITASQKILQIVPFCQIIMMSVQGESDYLRRSMLSGAREFLSKPFSQEEMVAAIRRVYILGASQRMAIPTMSPPSTSIASPTQTIPQKRGKIVSIFSLKGGVGCSTLAVNLAVALQHKQAKNFKVVLVDTCLQAGDIGILLKLKSDSSLSNLLKVSGKDFDEKLIKNVLTLHKSGLNVLPAPQNPDEGDTIPTDLVLNVLEQLALLFDVVLVDTSHILDEISLNTLFNLSDRIILVTTAEIPAIKDVKHFFDIAQTFDYDRRRIMLVMNKTNQHTQTIEKKTEEFLNHKIEQTVPQMSNIVTHAVNQGIPYVTSKEDSSLSQAVFNLSQRLLKNLDQEPSEPLPLMGVTYKPEEQGGGKSLLADNRRVNALLRDKIDQLEGERKELFHVIEKLEQKIESGDNDNYTPLTNMRGLISGIVHDLRGGLGIIENTAEFMLDEVEGDELLNSDIQKILQSAEFCRLVIQNLMSLGGTEFSNLIDVDIEAVIRETFFMLEDKLIDIDLVVNIDPAKPTLRTDKGQIKQLFMNLIKNAGEAMPNGGTLTIRTQSEADALRIEISDTGSGISPDNLDNIFDLHFTTKERGFGVGLHIVREIVERHGGAIKVKSEIDQGTKFIILWPVT